VVDPALDPIMPNFETTPANRPVLTLVVNRPSRFFIHGSVACPACGRALYMNDLGAIDDDAFHLQCVACGHVGMHHKSAVHVEARRERRAVHRPL
jgi:hypothetical protein